MNDRSSPSMILPSRPKSGRIGASERLLSRAVARRGTRYGREVPFFQLSAAVLVLALAGAATPTFAADATHRQKTGKPFAQAQSDGVFTGEFVNGVPVYRFPSVIVTADRKAEFDKSAEQPMRSGQTKAPAAPRGPA